MTRQLVINVDEAIYQQLQDQVGPKGISRFIEDAVRPHLDASSELDAGYAAMASDPDREREATEWAEALIGDACR